MSSNLQRGKGSALTAIVAVPYARVKPATPSPVRT
jgi:hypothetical protein